MAVAAVPACTDKGRPLVGEVPFDSAFEITSRVVLEETETALVVEPTIRTDPQGGLVVTDRSTQRIGKYSNQGKLEWEFGRSGPGPEEFSSPNVAIRIGPTQILVVDAHAKAMIWDEETQEVDRLLPYALASVDDADHLGEGRVLYSGRPAPGGPTDQVRTLHLIDTGSGEVEQSFFRPPLNDLTMRFASMAGWTSSDVNGDRVASVFALVDTVYLFSIEGEEQGKVPFATESFSRMDEPPAAGEQPGRYLMAHSFAATVDWIESDRVLVQYQEFENGSVNSHLLSLPIDGSPSWQVRNAPRLHHVSDDGQFYFADPERLEPNYLLVARLRTR